MRAPAICGVVLLFLAPAVVSVSADDFKVEAVKDKPPAGVAQAIVAELSDEGYRIIDDKGEPLGVVWLRKAVPTTAKPEGAKGAVQFPFLAEGELLGVVHLVGEAHDYRDQSIEPGLYSMRYGLQPINGDHLGVSPFRDYTLLLTADKDKSPAPLQRKKLEAESSEAAGTTHPAVFFMLAAPAGAPVAMIHDEDQDTWRVVLPLSLAVEGGSKPMAHPVSFIVSGMSPGA